MATQLSCHMIVLCLTVKGLFHIFIASCAWSNVINPIGIKALLFTEVCICVTKSVDSVYTVVTEGVVTVYKMLCFEIPCKWVIGRFAY